MGNILKRIKAPEDLKTLSIEELGILSKEIRRYLVQVLSENGGHLSSNLGVVELTLALHLTFQSPHDKLIWDVGHQSYCHKIITGRKEWFKTIRQYQGMSGYPKRCESEHDIFETGHSSTSLSAALGFVKARQLSKEDYYVVPVIGDGSLTGGIAFEALNNAGRINNSQLIVVLNDNQMSISPNVGGLCKYLDAIRTVPLYTEVKEEVERALKRIPRIGDEVVRTVRDVKSSIKQLLIPGMLFEELGFKYLGPVDGHNIQELITVFNYAKRLHKPVLVHVNTIKGKGLKYAEHNPTKFHGTAPFHIESGKIKSKSKEATYSIVLGQTLKKLGRQNDKLVGITAAMPEGTGLSIFQKSFPERTFDVGIAEQHAVTFAAGLASSGFKPVVAIYSSFLQRAYDQILHDVCLQNLPVIFAIDRAGLVGQDGETHHGIFDISFLNHIPNMTLLAPKNRYELESMLSYAVNYSAPIAIRYPRGKALTDFAEFNQPLSYGKSEILIKGQDVALIAVGSMVKKAVEVASLLKQHENVSCTVINARFIKPIDKERIEQLIKTHQHIVTIEENVLSGGFGHSVLNYVKDKSSKCRVSCIGIEDAFIQHGNITQLYKLCELDSESIYHKVKSILK